MNGWTDRWSGYCAVWNHEIGEGPCRDITAGLLRLRWLLGNCHAYRWALKLKGNSGARQALKLETDSASSKTSKKIEDSDS